MEQGKPLDKTILSDFTVFYILKVKYCNVDWSVHSLDVDINIQQRVDLLLALTFHDFKSRSLAVFRKHESSR